MNQSQLTRCVVTNLLGVRKYEKSLTTQTFLAVDKSYCLFEWEIQCKKVYFLNKVYLKMCNCQSIAFKMINVYFSIFTCKIGLWRKRKKKTNLGSFPSTINVQYHMDLDLSAFHSVDSKTQIRILEWKLTLGSLIHLKCFRPKTQTSQLLKNCKKYFCKDLSLLVKTISLAVFYLQWHGKACLNISFTKTT